MGGASEREFMEKLKKAREKMLKTEREIADSFARIEKAKLDAMKKAEDMRSNAGKDLERLEREIMKSADLATESKQRLSSEIITFKEDITKKYTDLKDRITKALVPR